MCLKLSFSHFKWVLQEILALTALSNWVYGAVQILTTLFSLAVPNFVMFFHGI